MAPVTAPDRKHRLARPSAEFQAVVMACRFPTSEHQLRSLEDLVASGVDWKLFLAIVKRHRVAGLVHHSISRIDKSLVPRRISQSLEEAAFSVLRNNMLAMRSAASLTKRMEEAGIETTTIKGVALGSTIYQDPGIRHSKDIDLLVSEHDVEAADAILRKSGYERQVPPRAWDIEADRSFRLYRSHYEYASAPGTPQIELHWRLQHNRHLGPMHLPRERQVRVEFAPGMWVWTLDEVDLLCYLCTHGSLHAWSRLKWVVDVATLLQRKPELRKRLVEQAKHDSTTRAIGQALLLCRDLFAIPLPSNLGRPTLAMRLLGTIAKGTLLVGKGFEEPADHPAAIALMHFSHLLIGEDRRYLVAEVRNKLLVPLAWKNQQSSKSARWIAPLRRVSHRLLSRS